MPKPNPKKVKLVVAKEKQPKVALRAGMRLEVVAVEMVDPAFKKAKGLAARLCGGTSTCLALVDVGGGDPVK